MVSLSHLWRDMERMREHISRLRQIATEAQAYADDETLYENESFRGLAVQIRQVARDMEAEEDGKEIER